MLLFKHRGIWFHIVDVLFNIAVIAFVVVGIRTFLVSPFQVEGRSMTPTLEDGEYIIINKLAYFVDNPRRGEVVVFRPPNDLSKYYVKRIIGEPGDTVIVRGGAVYLRMRGTTVEKKIEEPYLGPENRGQTYRHPSAERDASEARFSVPDGQYFVLGDNRQGSQDSRSFVGDNGKLSPFVPQSEIKGRVWFVALPLTKIHALQPAAY